MNVRSELHCHTKMSKMSGVADVKELIRTAKEMGMPAIAITDNETVQAFPAAFYEWDALSRNNGGGIKVLFGVEAGLIDDIDAIVMNNRDQSVLTPHRVIIIASSQEGIKNMYELISISDFDYSEKFPGIPMSEFEKYRKGVIIGDCAQNGDVSRAVFENRSDEDIKKLMSFYDFIEVGPVENYIYVTGRSTGSGYLSTEDVKESIKRIVKLGKEVSVPVIASSDVHYVKKSDRDAFCILRHATGFRDMKSRKAKHHLMTTEEMLGEFSFLGDEAEEIVIDNPNIFAEKLGVVLPINNSKNYPEYPNADKLLRKLCYRRAHDIYGKTLPGAVESRIEFEIGVIKKNGFASLYMIAYEIVKKSNEAGYVVGSRGPSGASFVSFLLGIMETNPLPAHYRCKKCGYVDFDVSGIDGFHTGDTGIDLPDAVCPNCKEVLVKDGYDLPVETFLGLHLDREPDFDFNLAGDYQLEAQQGVLDIEGIGDICRAGTISTVSKRLAMNYVKKYCKDKKLKMSMDKLSKVSEKLVGIRRGDDIHPGGIIPVPKGTDICSYTPVTAGLSDGIPKTQIEYHFLDGSLLKLDLLGHSTPAFLKYFSDETGKDPVTVPMEDGKVMSLFSGIEALGVNPDMIGGVEVGTLGVPEFGYNSVRNALEFIRPKRFSDIIRISGMMHGTWECDPLELIREKGVSISDFICTRDDIMLYLIDKGVDREKAFRIMEWVRKGKASYDFREEWAEELLEKGVPDWYKKLFENIMYLFPKAHSAGYTLMSWRILYYKLYYPEAFYKGWLKYYAHEINEDFAKQGYDFARNEFEALSITNHKKMGYRQQDKLDDLLVVMEMYARGVHLG